MWNNNDAESNLLVIEAGDADKGIRLDQFAATNAELTRSAAARLIEEGAVTVNGKSVAKNYKLGKVDTIEITLPEPEAAEALPENIPLDIVYEDEDVLMINKPDGMLSQKAKPEDVSPNEYIIAYLILNKKLTEERNGYGQQSH